jgi:hypothetical protein
VGSIPSGYYSCLRQGRDGTSVVDSTKWQKFVILDVCVAGINETTASDCGYGGGGGETGTLYSCLI